MKDNSGIVLFLGNLALKLDMISFYFMLLQATRKMAFAERWVTLIIGLRHWIQVKWFFYHRAYANRRCLLVLLLNNK